MAEAPTQGLYRRVCAARVPRSWFLKHLHCLETDTPRGYPRNLLGVNGRLVRLCVCQPQAKTSDRFSAGAGQGRGGLSHSPIVAALPGQPWTLVGRFSGKEVVCRRASSDHPREGISLVPGASVQAGLLLREGRGLPTAQPQSHTPTWHTCPLRSPPQSLSRRLCRSPHCSLSLEWPSAPCPRAADPT